MVRYGLSLLFLILLGNHFGYSQVAPDCENAVPICNNTPINGGTNGYGIDDFNGATVSGCMAQATGTIETNAAWYRFRAGENGQLGFNIGFDVNEDWDFALYRTNDCSNLGEPIRCNYFDNSDSRSFIGVGQDPSGADNIQYDDWLEVAADEEYYLLINNYSNNNSGFSIQFSGSIFEEFPNTALDCSIVDNLLGPPIIACETDNITLDATTAGAIGYEWYLDTGFGFQPIPGESSSQLYIAVSAMYRVLVIMPDGNNIISETQVAYAPSPATQALTNETTCLDGTLIDLTQKNSEALGDQSELEFRVTYHETQQEAFAGTNAMPQSFAPSITSQTIFVRTTSIENGNCFDASQSFEVYGIEVPSLDFETDVYLCGDATSATIGQRIPDSAYTYQWDSGETSSQITVTSPGVYTLTVTHTQGVFECMSERTVSVIFSSPPVITDVSIEYEDNTDNRVTVITEEAGDFEYRIDDGAPQNSSIFLNVFPGEHTVTVTDLNGCGIDTTEIVIVGFPKFFTPNADGINDAWKVEGISVLENPVITIYDRYGKLLYQLNESSSGWDGTHNGSLLPETDYWFKLSYTNSQGQFTTASYINNHFSLKR